MFFDVPADGVGLALHEGQDRLLAADGELAAGPAALTCGPKCFDGSHFMDAAVRGKQACDTGQCLVNRLDGSRVLLAPFKKAMNTLGNIQLLGTNILLLGPPSVGRVAGNRESDNRDFLFSSGK